METRLSPFTTLFLDHVKLDIYNDPLGLWICPEGPQFVAPVG